MTRKSGSVYNSKTNKKRPSGRQWIHQGGKNNEMCRSKIRQTNTIYRGKNGQQLLAISMAEDSNTCLCLQIERPARKRCAVEPEAKSDDENNSKYK